MHVMADSNQGHNLVSLLCVIPLTPGIQNPHDQNPHDGLFWPLGVGPRASYILGKHSTIELLPESCSIGITTILPLLSIQAQLLFLSQ